MYDVGAECAHMQAAMLGFGFRSIWVGMAVTGALGVGRVQECACLIRWCRERVVAIM